MNLWNYVFYTSTPIKKTQNLSSSEPKRLQKNLSPSEPKYLQKTFATFKKNLSTLAPQNLSTFKKK